MEIKDNVDPKPAPKTPAPVPFVVKTDGPDVRTAQPVEGGPTVPTSMGLLDRDTVMNNRVGGTGVVHMHADPYDAPPNAPVSSTAVVDKSNDRDRK
jgi:hypothetical protein